MFDKDEKMMTYQSALNDVVKKLREGRSQLAALAKKTVADFEAKIPILQNKTKDLTAQIQKLDAAISEKKLQYASEKTSFLADYETLKKALEDDHGEKMQEVADLKAAAEKLVDDLKGKNTQAEAKTSEFNNLVEINKTELANHKKAVAAFEDEKTKANAEITKTKDDIREIQVANRDLGDTLKRKVDQAQELTKTLDGKIAQANETIARIKEADDTLAKAVAKEAEVKKREEKNNADFVTIVATKKRQDKRDADQDKRDEALKVRETNVKLAEQTIAQ